MTQPYQRITTAELEAERHALRAYLRSWEDTVVIAGWEVLPRNAQRLYSRASVDLYAVELELGRRTQREENP